MSIEYYLNPNKAIKWWHKLPLEEQALLVNKYYPSDQILTLTTMQKVYMYEKENPMYQSERKQGE